MKILKTKFERIFQEQIFNKDNSKRQSLGRREMMPDGSSVMKEGTKPTTKENGEYIGKPSKIGCIKNINTEKW